MWIPSHAGIKNNEEVDLLANQAISSSPDSTEIKSLPYKDVLKIINRASS